MTFNVILAKFFPFFLLISLYAIYQNLFGYTQVELNWIKSGLGQVSEVGYFIRDDIRPISFLAGTPELTIFFCLYFLYFYRRKSFLGCIFCLSMMFVSGSRGVIVAFWVASFLMYFKARFWHRGSYEVLALVSLVINAGVYFLLTIVGPAVALLFPEKRLFVFGTFNARIETLLAFYENNKNVNFMLPTASAEIVYDNSYLSIVSMFTIFGLPIFLYYCLKASKDQKSFFAISLFLGYAFYADVIYSYYAMFLIFVCAFSRNYSARVY
ncbi:hypothetical protein [Luteithermobacter gelatinilyticus]|uniref:hypothetical protein n=1 Tax=Luteithermobacter gelatinilyticus TaxID=2582913 RepID=UPI001AF0095A|nr:hypothetical protein [Luteithermobacter gelatinilyticus]